MFSRHNERQNEEQQRLGAIKPGTSTGIRDAVAVPVSPELAPVARTSEETIVGREDRVEGTIRTQKGLRILGQLSGKIEASTSVFIEEGAKVDADLTTNEAIIAGQYSGKLVCRERLELRSTGLVKGEIETVRLMLHEGGFIDGELHMKRPDQSTTQPDSSIRGGITPRLGATESTSSSSVREPVASGTAGSSSRSTRS